MSLRPLLPLAAAVLAVLPFAASPGGAETRLTGPVIHDNVALYFVHGSSAPGPVPMTLEEGLARGTVEVQETGSVQELKIENRGAEPVFVQIGDIVKGGKQDRVITASLLLEPNSRPVSVGAFCVEQGRWAARGKEDATRFALSESLMPSRQAKVALARKAVPAAPAEPERGAGAGTPPVAAPEAGSGGFAVQQRLEQRTARGQPRDDGQGEVWRSVAAMQRMLSSSLNAPVAAEESRTSLQLSLENDRLKQAQAAVSQALLPAGTATDDIVGVVVAIGGWLSSADVYPSNGLFRKMWPKLARAAAIEGLAAKANVHQGLAPSLETARAFLAEAEAAGAKETRRDLAGVGSVLGRESEKVLRVEARSQAGAAVHRNYVAK